MHMDYIDLLHGHTPRNFWTMAKIDLAAMLVSRHASRGHAGKRCKILDVGAGVGNEILALQEYGHVSVLDIDERALRLIPDTPGVKKFMGDATNLPFEDAIYDIVVAFDVLEHIEDDRLAIREAKRVLIKGGAFLATAPAHPRLFGQHDKSLGHHRRYTKHELQRKLAGFTTVKLSFWNAMLFPAVFTQRCLRKDQEPERAVARLSSMINTMMFHALRVETRFLERGGRIPLGLSLLIECIV